jgi:phosphoglycolate phosphatase-like HAD superfamily hydrolase
MTFAAKSTTSIHFAPGFAPRPEVTHVLFDFDGTLSLIREGWPDVMVPMFVEMLPRSAGETEADLRRMVFEDIMRLNGKQTIYQMIQLADRIRERGGQPREALWYKHEYLRRLDERIAKRKSALRSGEIARENFLVHEAWSLLTQLRDRGLTLYLASGTDEQYVKEEASLLGLDQFFGRHIYGALDNYQNFSKKMVIDRILAENAIDGRRLLAFGDGYVEIENTKQVGGLAVAVASDEAHNGSGRMDEWKRERLLGVGADVVIPDFRDAAALLRCLFDDSSTSTFATGSFAGMTLNERLFHAGLLDDFDQARQANDRDRLLAILCRVELTAESAQTTIDQLNLPLLPQGERCFGGK